MMTAAIAIACTGRTDKVNNDRRVQAGGNRGVNERLSLQGCIEAAPGTNTYVLRNVVEVAPEQQPQGQERMEHAPLVPRGSWVRLTSGDADDLKNYLGKHVTVTGMVRDAGGNTIGTAGQSSTMPRAGEANGNAPQIAVEHVKESQGMCGTLPGDSGRPPGR
ncbi:MAG TPA: hypothetical protein VEL51_10625 [Vicinamibacterales bacterium]|nr:hypothetical protein [Vicinamibacterales bacterium]